jgi:hypothetical protein
VTATRASSETPQIVVGPLLRYTGTTTATLWMETDEPTEVEVLGHRTATFQVEGHHYALVVVDTLEPGTVTPYEVELNGRIVWPPDDGRPPCAIHTREFERQSRLVFGSCRVGMAECEPFTQQPSAHPEGVGVDALWAYSKRLQAGATPWPDALLLLGDQIYADEPPPETTAFIRRRRDPSLPPGYEVADFEEFTQLYRESWSDPDIRWLLATVPSTMIFDDHDVNDDWNISAAWVAEMRARPWWDARITGAFMSYWLYQHVGNLAPPELARDEVLRLVRQDPDGGSRLRELARQWDRESAASRWAYSRDFGRSRLLVIDSRAARVLADGRRDMIDEEEWEWIVEHARGDFDHLIIASTLPVFMAHGLHHLEAFSEAVCDGVWGRLPAWLGERLRRGVDLEHWPAFHDSFLLLIELLREISHAEKAPGTILFLGGDVHTAYVAKVALGTSPDASRVYQIVCSPFRHPLSPMERRAVHLTGSRAAGALLSRLARLARVPEVPVTWDFVQGPTFENSIGTLELDERAARLTISRSGEDPSHPTLEPLHRMTL